MNAGAETRDRDRRAPEAVAWTAAGISLAGLLAELLIPELRVPFLPAEAYLFFAVLACGLAAVVAVLAFVHHRLSGDVLSLGVSLSFAALGALAQLGLSSTEPLAPVDAGSAAPGGAAAALLIAASVASRRFRKSSTFLWRPFLWGSGALALSGGLLLTFLRPGSKATFDTAVLVRPWQAISLAVVVLAGLALTRSRSDRSLRRCLSLGLGSLAVSDARLLLLPVASVSAQPYILLAAVPAAAFFLSRFGEAAAQLTSTSVELEEARLHLTEKSSEAERRTQELTSETLARQRAEASLAETEDRLASVLGAAPMALVAFEGGEVRVAEGSALPALPIPRVAAGRLAAEIFADHPLERAAYERSSHGESVNVEAKGPSGTFELRFGPLALADRKQGVLLLALDITERRRAQEELARNKASLESLLESLPDTVLRVSPAGDLLSFRPRWGAALELPTKGPFRRLSELLPADSAALLLAACGRVVETGSPESMEIALGPPESARTHEARVVRSGPADAVVLVRDVEERKAAERLRDEVISMVSHELRAPLSAVRGALGLIDGVYGPSLPGDVGSLVETALRSTDRLIRLIHDLLDLEKIESGEIPFRMLRLDLVDVVRQAVESVRSTADDAGVRLTVEGGAGLSRVEGDPDRLTQVVTNLLSNAVKFSPDGGVVRVRLLPSPQGPGFVRLAVEDEGPGIPETFRSRIFSRFARAEGSGRTGTGLGLNISKTITTKHGGSLSFESTTGKGTTFFVDLPAVASGDVEAP